MKKLRTDQFAGLVFGTLSPEAPPLSDYIGNLIGSHIGRVMRGKPKILGTTSQILHNNWKLYFENVKDTYHASLLHSFFTTFRVSRLTNTGGVAIAEGGAHHFSYTYGGKGTDQAASDAAYAGIQSMHADYRLRDPRFLNSVDEIGDGITLQILSVFPNFVLQQIHNSIALRLVLPKGPEETELQWIFIGFEDDDAAMTERRLQQANLVGPAGYVSMEDGAVGGFIQRAIKGGEDDAIARSSRWAAPSTPRRRRARPKPRCAGSGRPIARRWGSSGDGPRRQSSGSSSSRISTPTTPPASIRTRSRHWPEFFTDDCIYRITSAENYEAGLPLGLIYATSKNMLSDRVSALRQANIYEPQRYRHLISLSVQIAKAEPDALDAVPTFWSCARCRTAR